ncbi:unnamed protein product, partial [Meganyctiphanes norvegica]
EGNNSRSPLIGNFTGYGLQKQITSETNQMFLLFTSFSRASGEGLHITWDFISDLSELTTATSQNKTTLNSSLTKPQIPFENCRQTFYEMSGHLEFPYINFYPSWANCVWTIKIDPDYPMTLDSDSGYSMTLDFWRFDLHAGDFLIIRDGNQDNYEVLGNYTSDNPPKNLKSNSSEVFLQFISDGSGSGSGFSVYWERYTECRSTASGNSGYIDFPTGNATYSPNSYCIWTIETTSNSVLEVNFLEFDTQQYYDYLHISDGNSSNGNYIGRYSGNFLPNSGQYIDSHTNQIYLLFTSDDTISRNGFSLYWEKSTDCGSHLTGNGGSIRYQPNHYDGFYNYCRWTISTDYGKNIELEFQMFNITHGDQFIIRQGNTSRSPLISIYTVNIEPSSISTNSNHLYLQFSSIGYAYERDIQISWRRKTDNECGGKVEGISGYIHYPLGLDMYRNNSYCLWTILTTPGAFIHLQFERFDTEKYRDYITI